MSEEKKTSREELEAFEAVSYYSAAEKMLLESLRSFTIGSLLLKHGLDLGFAYPSAITELLEGMKISVDTIRMMGGDKKECCKCAEDQIDEALNRMGIPDKDNMN